MTTSLSNPFHFNVLKRDGETLQPFSFDKVANAIRKAWTATRGEADESKIRQLSLTAAGSVLVDDVEVEKIQDSIEVTLMRAGYTDVAKSFILYRDKRAQARVARRSPDPLAVSDYIHFSKYARYLPDELRREVFSETVDRVEDMHLRRFPALSDEIRWAFNEVREKRVLPSMRSMQFGGKAIESNHCRMYNCCFSHIDRFAAFGEAMFLLLSGCGVGYSVQFDHVDKLPPLGFVDPKQVYHHTIADSIEGWGDAIKALFSAYQQGEYIEFSYHLIRRAGTPLKTSGGRAPGHLKLKATIEAIRAILHGAQGRRLRPIECHRALCHIADAVLSGGIRRSAMIALFSMDDGEMMNCKTGDWFEREPWFANANNSAVVLRSEAKEKQFKRVFQMTKQWGDPGFVFVSDINYGTNPCAEIGLNPLVVMDDHCREWLRKRFGDGILLADSLKLAYNHHIGATYTGWAFCNLCEINASKITSLREFLLAARAAAIIGTLQASYTTMPYLGWVSEYIAEREALLGIGMTGMLDSPEVSLDPEFQRLAAETVVGTNKEYAARIGINAAARTTCVKPSGTTSLELGCVASGHHAHHARRYIRRVTADELEFVFQKYREVNPGMCVRKPDGKWVIEFPVEAPPNAVIKADLTAIQFLDMVRSTQRNWVLSGTVDSTISPGLHHNVSNTIHVKHDEWEAVADYLWKHREDFTGVALISNVSDKQYAFAPNEAVVTEADEARWNALIAGYKPVDYKSILEAEDGTALMGEVACAAGGCST